jgi:SAM-dependent methyltransferase
MLAGVTDPWTPPDAPRARAEREYTALFRIQQRHADTPARRDRSRHPAMIGPGEAVRLLVGLAAGSAVAEDGEDAVDAADLTAALTLMPMVRAEIDQLEASLLLIARGHGMTWQQLAFWLGLGSAQAARQRYERLNLRAAPDNVPTSPHDDVLRRRRSAQLPGRERAGGTGNPAPSSSVPPSPAGWNRPRPRRRSSSMDDVDGNVGTGPGVITNDGCAVEFYALLPTFGEPEIVHAAVPAGASILELGCGTGRILRPLAALGHPVVGVDDSPEMLARSPDLATVCSPIGTLRLGRTFDVVLLASTLINADPGTRREFLATVRQHLGDDGTAVFQQSPPDWFETVEQAVPVRDDPGGIRRILRVARWEPPRLRAEVEYQVGGNVWTQAWTSYQLSDEELAGHLAAAGLRLGDWLTSDHAWFTARAA